MAGTIVADQLQDGAGNSTSMDNAIYGSAKAWVNYNANAKTISASYNISSVTYVASTQYTLNFTNALVDANYATVATCGNLYGSSNTQQYMLIRDSSLIPTTTQVQVSTSGSQDPNRVCVAIFR